MSWQNSLLATKAPASTGNAAGKFAEKESLRKAAGTGKKNPLMVAKPALAITELPNVMHAGITKGFRP